MKKNVGNVDRLIRIIIGILLLLLLLTDISYKQIGLIGIVPLLTGLIRFCPLYLIFGIKTSSNDKNQKM